MNATQCPKCNAALPPRGRFCLECGCDLYEAEARRPPLRRLKSLLVCLGVVSLLVVLALASRGRLLPRSQELPPEERAVRDLTRELLSLVAERRYAEVVRRFYQPNAEEFETVSEALREIVRDRGSHGLTIFQATCMDDLEEAKKFVDGYGAKHPEYVVGVLAALTFQDGALRTTLGGTLVGAQRAEDFCAWHFSVAFRGLDAKQARVEGVSWQDGPRGDRLLVATVRYPELPARVAGTIDPVTLSWRPVGVDGWALSFGQPLNLDEVLNLLLQVKL